MRTPHAAATGLDEIGLTWFLHRLDGGTTLSHGGGTNGQVAILGIFPEQEFAVAVCANGTPGGGELIRETRDIAFRSYVGLEAPDPRPLDLTAGELAEYAGRFSSAMVDIDIRVEDGGLVEHETPRGGFPRKDSPPRPCPPPSDLVFYDRDRAVVPEGMFKGTRSEFLRDGEGRVAWYRAGGRVLKRSG